MKEIEKRQNSPEEFNKFMMRQRGKRHSNVVMTRFNDHSDQPAFVGLNSSLKNIRNRKQSQAQNVSSSTLVPINTNDIMPTKPNGMSSVGPIARK